MSVFHDEVEIEDFEYDEDTETYSYPCPCGDRFLITREEFSELRLHTVERSVVSEVSSKQDLDFALYFLTLNGMLIKGSNSYGLLQEDLENGEDVATCPSCSLIIRVIYDKEQFMCGEEVSPLTESKKLVKC